MTYLYSKRNPWDASSAEISSQMGLNIAQRGYMSMLVRRCSVPQRARARPSQAPSS
eukprot:CAMPEP_0183462050 /NCGR_PEP_ID=MMETSP0370-20130417/140944_1 /TAXON_ID=268820 /ORGANISM="Peridinium aciculiferum, Strain PAER-2" /LENGTH=55 /DNA_ID=CAMNT_0025654047 /DNA_START=106 /DNA_END=270 /DNA_ORIENTATION=+